MALTPEQRAALEAQRIAILSEPQSVTTDAGSMSMGSLSVRLSAIDKILANDATGRRRPLGGAAIVLPIMPGTGSE